MPFGTSDPTFSAGETGPPRSARVAAAAARPQTQVLPAAQGGGRSGSGPPSALRPCGQGGLGSPTEALGHQQLPW